ncbi:DNA mismatch repair protein MutS [Kordia sp. YSTF-M3]|uniref:DNA mismatch repair protein MutS n=1 Tax=Kordia aestuariivivens TaxID=2759037 RepID=A0ABR7Q952_9FLAO|nr:DNA mismatch repair protein MutS [Kordia aestuariivivens]MBC8755081.1 DNA mismatch repair protein MutS [Kordia aestuariivivens]
MIKIHSKTLDDLEFETVLQQVSTHAITAFGKQKINNTQPFEDKDVLLTNLACVNEYLASFANENVIPNHGFDGISLEIKLLAIENSFLEIQGFRKISAISSAVNLLLKFFKKFQEYYPTLQSRAEQIEFTKDLVTQIDSVINRFGEVKDSASPSLGQIRRGILSIRGKINQSFSSALSKYNQADYLDEIRETVVDNRRVLAVKAMYRRKVKGAIMGNSKTGSIVYIEPEITLQYSRELTNLEYEEKEEVTRILKELTDYIRPFASLLAQYQDFLSDLDVSYAKAKYAESMDAILPEISEERILFLKDAYHPLLYLTNKERNEKTYPQTIELKSDNRIIVISGPNAGGKSITLKTIGLLQVMLQSGMLIPVHERSKVCLFERILTDIGDNQSIENHLSTYSYRLKQMNYFLKRCNNKTLFLIDEFGTGSDPELGGALAETFLEVFYEREAFGIITTHYSNLKLLANELPHATNANMLFDNKTLLPVYKLALGQAGSSFTFEVAQKNGIPYSLINRAKKKIERGKVRFDATIAKLQKERSAMEKTSKLLKEEEIKAREENERLEALNTKTKTKLESYQQLYDHDKRMIHLGNKINEIADRYFDTKKKRPLISEFLRIVETENSKRKKQTVQEKKIHKVKQQTAKKEVIQKVAVIREEKKVEKKKAAKKEASKPKPVLKVGDRVRMHDGKAVGSIDTLERGKAVVNYGMFTTTISVDQLELVQAMK